jgi:protein disulfide-isomerase
MARIRIPGGLLLAALLAAHAAGAEGIAWRSDPEAAQREAATSGRLVLLHFSGTFCPPCRMMEHTVFNRTDVAQAVERDYVPVAVDVQKSQALSRQYGIQKIPADVVVTPSGQLINKSEGAKSAQDYVAALSRIAQYARGANPGGQLGQASPGGSVFGQPPGSTVPNVVTPPVSGRNGLGAAPPGIATQSSPFAPRVGQQFVPESKGEPPGVPGLGNTLAPPAAPTPSGPFSGSGPFSASPPSLGQGANGALPPWATGPQDRAAPNLGAPNVVPPNVIPPNSGVLPGGQPFAPAPPSGTSTFGASPPLGQSPPGASPFAPQALPSMPSQQPKLPPLGFDGFCPVTMFHQKRWAPGDRRWGVIHEGRLYLFVSPEAKAAFFADPNRYAPVLSGDDVVVFAESGQRFPGQVRIGAQYAVTREQPPRTYLFASEESFQKFNANPLLYLERLRQALSAGAANR